MAGFNVDCPMLKIVLIIVGPGSVESMPISVLNVGSYYNSKDGSKL